MVMKNGVPTTSEDREHPTVIMADGRHHIPPSRLADAEHRTKELNPA
jgi:hypothetical protein